MRLFPLTQPARDFDILFVGGGLANVLAARAISLRNPTMRMGIIERHDRLGVAGSSHTWSFHVSDICNASDFDTHWMRPYVSKIWGSTPGYAVRFPQLRRSIELGYGSIRSETFHEAVLTERFAEFLWNREVVGVSAKEVRLADGTSLSARLVVDGRGWTENRGGTWPMGYQKFLGQFIRTGSPHGMKFPILMDGTVDQEDGFHFVYALPFAEDLLLVEDTYYSLSNELRPEVLRQRIRNWLEREGIPVGTVESEETGVLPIPLAGRGEPEFLPGKSDSVVSLGLRAGLFHPVTGYSLVHAVKAAELLSQLIEKIGETSLGSIPSAMAQYSRLEWRKGGYLRRLNNMFFMAAPPQERYKILEKFYRHEHHVIERFYGNRLGVRDKLAIVSGKPPVAVGPAVRAFFGWTKGAQFSG